MTPTLQDGERIAEIMAEFNFAEARAIMKRACWTWKNSNGHRVPSITDIRAEAFRLLNLAAHNDCISCGGLTAQRHQGELILTFGVTTES